MKTIKEMGEWKFYKLARAIKILSEVSEFVEEEENDPRRKAIRKALNKEHQGKSLKEVLESPVSCLVGMEGTDALLKKLHLETVEKLSHWKYCRWAEALTLASRFENQEF